jgi:hypothetical protein
MTKTVLGAMAPIALLGAMVACSSESGSTEPGNPVAISWAPCINDLDAPSWFAVQDGTKAWTRVTPTNGVFEFTVRADKIGVATFSSGFLVITYATPAEIQAAAPGCNSARRTVSGTVTGYTSLDETNIQADAGAATVSGIQAATASFSLDDVTPLPFDVLATRSRSTFSGSTFQRTPTSVFIRRAQNGSTLALMDLNSATEAGAPLTQTVTIVNAAAAENISVIASLNTPTTAIDMGAYVSTLGSVSAGVTAPFYGLPSARLIAGESQTLDVLSTKTVSSTTSESRSIALNYTAAADKTATLGAALGPISVTGSSHPSATYTVQTGYDQTFEFDVDQGSGISARSIQVIMTRAYAGSATTQVSLQVPDLAGVTGFQSAWGITPGLSATWTFFAAGATTAVFRHNDQNYAAASRTSTFTP